MRRQIITVVMVGATVAILATVWIKHRSHFDRDKEKAVQSPETAATVDGPVPLVTSDGTRTLSVSTSAEGSSGGPKGYVRDDTIEAIRLINDIQRDAWERQKAARALPKNLTAEERAILASFLKTWHDEDGNQVGHVLKNDLMDALIAQETPAMDIAELFAAVYRDANQNIVIRDYAVQHLALLVERLQEAPAGWSETQIESQQKVVEGVLLEILTYPDSRLAGTALLGLTRLSESGFPIDRIRLSDAALKMASDSKSPSEARITAFQVCARLGAREALPLLTETAQRSEDTMARISAVSALGILGNAPELAVAEEIVSTGNERLKNAAAIALRRIQDRMALNR